MNYIKIYETQSFEPLSRTGKICKLAPKLMEQIEDEVIDTFGVSGEFKRRRRAIVERELLLAQMMRTGDRSLQFEIEMSEKEIRELSTPAKDYDLYAAMAWIKIQGIDFKENEITVFWYYKYMDFLNKKLAKEAEQSNQVKRR